MVTDDTTDALIALSVDFADQRHDMAVPATVPVSDMLPHIVDSLGRLTATTATQGFSLVTQSGRELDQSRTLAEQGVAPGAVLILAPAGASDADLRYDDLAEAIGRSLDHSRAAWTRADSVALSAYSSAGLLVIAAVLAALGLGLWYALAIDLVGAVLTVFVAVFVARNATSPGGATALALAAAAMLASAGWVAGPLTALPNAAITGAGVGLVIGSAGLLVLPQPSHPIASAPFTVGIAAAAFGLALAFGLTPLQIGSAVVALAAVVTLVAPWIGLATIPARIPALSGVNEDGIDVEVVRRQVRGGATLVLSLRIATAVVTVALVPVVGASVLGALLMMAVGVAFMLGTRVVYGRAEAMVGVVAGLVTIVLTGVVATVSHVEFLPWTIAASLLVALVVLANNVVSPAVRPQLSRVADVVHVVALVAILPLAVLVWTAPWA